MVDLFVEFPFFSPSILASIFNHRFNGKWTKNDIPGIILLATFFALVAPWLPFGSLLAPFGSLWAPFGSLLAPFGSLLAPFGSLLAPFGSLLAPFRHPPGSFSHFRQLFGLVLAFFTFFGSKFAPK